MVVGRWSFGLRIADCGLRIAERVHITCDVRRDEWIWIWLRAVPIFGRGSVNANGVVLDVEGRRVPGATVRWACTRQRKELNEPDGTVNEVVTDAEGEFASCVPRAAPDCVFLAAKEGRGHGFLALMTLLVPRRNSTLPEPFSSLRYSM